MAITIVTQPSEVILSGNPVIYEFAASEGWEELDNYAIHVQIFEYINETESNIAISGISRKIPNADGIIRFDISDILNEMEAKRFILPQNLTQFNFNDIDINDGHLYSKYVFKLTDNGFTVSGGTKTSYENFITLISTGSSLQFKKEGISASGKQFRYVYLKIRNNNAIYKACSLFYATAGHDYNSSYRYDFFIPPSDQDWKIIKIDMWELTAGGTDWKDNVITKLRLDPGSANNEEFSIEYILIGAELGTPAIKRNTIRKKIRISYYEYYGIPYIQHGNVANTNYIVVLSGGLGFLALADYNKNNLNFYTDFIYNTGANKFFLMWKDSIETDPQAIEKLYYLIGYDEYDNIGVKVRAIVHYTDGTTATIDNVMQMYLNMYDLLEIQCDVASLALPYLNINKTIDYYTIQLENPGATEQVIFKLKGTPTKYRHEFIFINSFGVAETIRTYGKLYKRGTYETNIINNNIDNLTFTSLDAEEKVTEIKENINYEVEIGYRQGIDGKIFYENFREFMLSNEKYILFNGVPIRIIVDSKNLNLFGENYGLQNNKISFRMAHSNKYVDYAYLLGLSDEQSYELITDFAGIDTVGVISFVNNYLQAQKVLTDDDGYATSSEIIVIPDVMYILEINFSLVSGSAPQLQIEKYRYHNATPDVDLYNLVAGKQAFIIKANGSKITINLYNSQLQLTRYNCTISLKKLTRSLVSEFYTNNL